MSEVPLSRESHGPVSTLVPCSKGPKRSHGCLGCLCCGLAELDARKAGDGHGRPERRRSPRDHLLDGELLVILPGDEELLVLQNHLLLPLSEAPPSHLLSDVRGLSALCRLLHEDLFLGGQICLGNILHTAVQRHPRGDMHRELDPQLFERRGVSRRCLQSHQHPHLAEVGGDGSMDVPHHPPCRHLEGGSGAQLAVLANRGHHLLDSVAHRHGRLRLGPRGKLRQLEILERHAGRRRQAKQADLERELLEHRVLRHEIRLRVQLNNRALLARLVDHHPDQPVGGLAALLLGRRRHAFLPEPLHCDLEVPPRVLQRPLAVHHRRPSLVTQELDFSRRHLLRERPLLGIHETSMERCWGERPGRRGARHTSCPCP
mmetsp:Transcript_1386/g.3196  ORF Transcript_1386/g.3196 Transcript_1386/m.3196 type:complete len:374 (+) Transcript_1386:78-1199(+)